MNSNVNRPCQRRLSGGGLTLIAQWPIGVEPVVGHPDICLWRASERPSTKPQALNFEEASTSLPSDPRGNPRSNKPLLIVAVETRRLPYHLVRLSGIPVSGPEDDVEGRHEAHLRAQLPTRRQPEGVDVH